MKLAVLANKEQELIARNQVSSKFITYARQQVACNHLQATKLPQNCLVYGGLQHSCQTGSHQDQFSFQIGTIRALFMKDYSRHKQQVRLGRTFYMYSAVDGHMSNNEQDLWQEQDRVSEQLGKFQHFLLLRSRIHHILDCSPANRECEVGLDCNKTLMLQGKTTSLRGRAPFLPVQEISTQKLAPISRHLYLQSDISRRKPRLFQGETKSSIIARVKHHTVTIHELLAAFPIVVSTDSLWNP